MILSSYLHEIIRVITNDRGDVHAKGQGQRSKIKVTKIKTNFAPIWAFPDRNSSLKVDYLIIFIICDTDLVNKLTLQMYTLHKYK